MRLIQRLQCWFAGRHWLGFVRNIYGDEIMLRNWMRSEWRCNHCGLYVYKPDLLKDAGSPTAAPGVVTTMNRRPR